MPQSSWYDLALTANTKGSGQSFFSVIDSSSGRHVRTSSLSPVRWTIVLAIVLATVCTTTPPVNLYVHFCCIYPGAQKRNVIMISIGSIRDKGPSYWRLHSAVCQHSCPAYASSYQKGFTGCRRDKKLNFCNLQQVNSMLEQELKGSCCVRLENIDFSAFAGTQKKVLFLCKVLLSTWPLFPHVAFPKIELE
jgi:hypothetical protein